MCVPQMRTWYRVKKLKVALRPERLALVSNDCKQWGVQVFSAQKVASSLLSLSGKQDRAFIALFVLTWW